MATPPKNMPENLRDLYTLNGRIAVEEWYFDGSYSQDCPKFYSRQEIKSFVEMAKSGKKNYYGKTDQWLYRALQKYPVRDLEVAIMGSVVPWYESVCLAFGGKPTTIEYNAVATDHPGLKVMSVGEFRRSPRQFDAAFSISSFEHDGLGRYGDPLNPNGDLEAMAEMKNIVKPGGLLYLAVPIGRDKVVWNAHRIYGRKRLPLLLKGWQIIGKFGYNFLRLWRDTGKDGGYQPVFVLRKPQ